MQNRELKVLLVEDNLDHCELIENALKRKDENFQLDVCRDKKTLFEILARRKYDALLVDYHLPDGDGIEILEELLMKNDRMPVIFISGSDNDEIITRTLHAGAADFVIKSRTTLQTLPIIIKRNIIRKLAHEAESAKTTFAPLKDSLLYRHLNTSLKKISRATGKILRALGKGRPLAMSVDEIKRLEELLDRTGHILKSIRRTRAEKVPSQKNQANPPKEHSANS